MLLQRAGNDDAFLPFEGGYEQPPHGTLPPVTPSIIHEAFVLRGQFGLDAEAELDRRLVHAMQDCRLDEVNHLWAVWRALKGNA